MQGLIYNKKFKILIVFMLCFTITTSIYVNQRIESEAFIAETLTIATFSSLIKILGVTGLTVGAIYTLYNNWESVTDNAIIQEIKNIQTLANTGFSVVSRNVYNSIVDYISSFNVGSSGGIELSDPTYSYGTISLGMNELTGSYLQDDRIYFTEVKYINVVEVKPTTTKFRPFSPSSLAAPTHYYIFGNPKFELIWTGTNMRAVFHYANSQGVWHESFYNYSVNSNDDFVNSGYINVAPELYDYSPTNTHAWDTPYWDNKTHIDVETGEENILVPPIPADWLNKPYSTPMPDSYLNNPVIDYPTDLPASTVWTGEGVDAGEFTGDIGTIGGALTGKLKTPGLPGVIEKIEQIDISQGAAPKITVNLNAFYKAITKKEHPNLPRDATLIDFAFMESPQWSFMGFNLISLFRAIVSFGFVWTTFNYVHRKITPDEVIN